VVNKKNVKSWFQGAVLYQIYPRSFQDSNDDGVGDLNGIRQRLDYLNDGKGGGLGIDCIWISPFFPSPMKDFGYDISNYCEVDPVFGTLENFINLLNEAHNRGIRVLIDLVPNHTSDQHLWFKLSQRSSDNEKESWYIWRDAKADGSPPNNWLSVFGGSAWEWSETRQQFYCHSFLKEQPDLNWENPEVQKAMSDVMRFWLDKGVDGFRVDAIDLMGKNLNLEDEAINPSYKQGEDPYLSLIHSNTRDAGNFFNYLRLMADIVGEYDDRLLVLESFILERHKPELYWQFYNEIDKPFCLPFNFELIFMDWSAKEIQTFVDAFQAGLRKQDLPIYILGNHDQPRFASKAGPDNLRAGALLLLCLPGLSLIYNGEEIGMHNVDLPEEYKNDPHNRDGYRTPMQWSNEHNAGFSNGTPWLPTAHDYQSVNVSSELEDTSSLLNFYRALIRLRGNLKALKDGSYEPTVHYDNVVSFIRKTEEQTMLIMVNFSGESIETSVESKYKIVFSTLPSRPSFEGLLKPYEGIVLELITNSVI